VIPYVGRTREITVSGISPQRCMIINDQLSVLYIKLSVIVVDPIESKDGPNMSRLTTRTVNANLRVGTELQRILK